MTRFIFGLANKRCWLCLFIKKVETRCYRNAIVFLPNPFQRFSNKGKAKRNMSTDITLMGLLNRRTRRTKHVSIHRVFLQQQQIHICHW